MPDIEKLLVPDPGAWRPRRTAAHRATMSKIREIRKAGAARIRGILHR